jgi:hypothetical protein
MLMTCNYLAGLLLLSFCICLFLSLSLTHTEVCSRWDTPMLNLTPLPPVAQAGCDWSGYGLCGLPGDGVHVCRCHLIPGAVQQERGGTVPHDCLTSLSAPFFPRCSTARRRARSTSRCTMSCRRSSSWTTRRTRRRRAAAVASWDRRGLARWCPREI